jgi:hypothetical protein
MFLLVKLFLLHFSVIRLCSPEVWKNESVGIQVRVEKNSLFCTQMPSFSIAAAREHFPFNGPNQTLVS